MAARDAARRRGPARQRPEPAGNGPANGPAAALRRPVTAAGPPARLPAARRGAGPRPGGVCVCVWGEAPGFLLFPPVSPQNGGRGGPGALGGSVALGEPLCPSVRGRRRLARGLLGRGGRLCGWSLHRASARVRLLQGVLTSAAQTPHLYSYICAFVRVRFPRISHQDSSKASSVQLYPP